MGVVGQWDAGLFMRFAEVRALARPFTEAQDARYCRLLAELARINQPLVHHLLGELCGGREKRRGRRSAPSGPRRVAGAENLSREDRTGAAQVALVKALVTLDPSRAALATHLRWQLIGELSRAVRGEGAVSGKWGRLGPKTVYLEQDEQLGALLERDAEAPELRSAVGIFVEECCTFAGGARSTARLLWERLEAVAIARGEAVTRFDLRRALAQRGARTTFIRDPRTRMPVRGFAGVRLQNVGARMEASVNTSVKLKTPRRVPIFLHGHELGALAAATGLSVSTVRRWADGDDEGVSSRTVKQLNAEMEKLGFERRTRREAGDDSSPDSRARVA